jgi:hypothetical protein
MFLQYLALSRVPRECDAHVKTQMQTDSQNFKFRREHIHFNYHNRQLSWIHLELYAGYIHLK